MAIDPETGLEFYESRYEQESYHSLQVKAIGKGFVAGELVGWDSPGYNLGQRARVYYGGGYIAGSGVLSILDSDFATAFSQGGLGGYGGFEFTMPNTVDALGMWIVRFEFRRGDCYGGVTSQRAILDPGYPISERGMIKAIAKDVTQIPGAWLPEGPDLPGTGFWVDGHKKGDTPLNVEVTAEYHYYEFTRSNYTPSHFTVPIRENKITIGMRYLIPSIESSALIRTKRLAYHPGETVKIIISEYLKGWRGQILHMFDTSGGIIDVGKIPRSGGATLYWDIPVNAPSGLCSLFFQVTPESDRQSVWRFAIEEGQPQRIEPKATVRFESSVPGSSLNIEEI